jgi:hypothetical protein
MRGFCKDLAEEKLADDKRPAREEVKKTMRSKVSTAPKAESVKCEELSQLGEEKEDTFVSSTG